MNGYKMEVMQMERTNECYGDEDEKDDFEPDYDSINDNIWLQKKEEEEEQQQKGDVK